MTRKNAASKARRYLAEGRLTITRVDGRDVRARVRCDGVTYRTAGRNPARPEGVRGVWAAAANGRFPLGVRLRGASMFTIRPEELIVCGISGAYPASERIYQRCAPVDRPLRNP